MIRPIITEILLAGISGTGRRNHSTAQRISEEDQTALIHSLAAELKSGEFQRGVAGRAQSPGRPYKSQKNRKVPKLSGQIQYRQTRDEKNRQNQKAQHSQPDRAGLKTRHA